MNESGGETRGGPAHDERGATSSEYAIMAACIAVAVVVVVGLLGLAVAGLFQRAVDAWPA
ncbi:MAG TPA: Flp family type IVb pilin [Acidimicrobiia bacterium]|nr:Flp family type IVb pilin [Acidimicrobiia bacterium]